MNSKAEFAIVPTPNPDEAVPHGRWVYNDSTGLGMDILLQVVKEHVPEVQNPEAFTTKRIIYTARYECPCCPTSIDAFVQVDCEGLYTEDTDRVVGLWSVSIYRRNHLYDPSKSEYKARIEKLVGRSEYECEYETKPIPKKDYSTPRKSEKGRTSKKGRK